VGRLFAEVAIAASLQARREILLTLVLVNGCLTLAFALGGYFVRKRMLRPLGVLTRYVEQIREGRVEPIPRGYRWRVASEVDELLAHAEKLNRLRSERGFSHDDTIGRRVCGIMSAIVRRNPAHEDG